MNVNPINSGKPKYDSWSNRPTPLRIRSGFYRFLSTMIKPFDKNRAALYQFRAKRADKKSFLYSNDKEMKKIFEDRWMGRTLNVPNTPSLKEFKGLTKQKKATKKSVMQDIQMNYPDAKLLEKTDKVKPIDDEGRCSGLVLDLAEKYLNQSENNAFSEVLDKLSTGLPLNAEINQGTQDFRTYPTINFYQERLFQLKANFNGLFAAESDHVSLLLNTFLNESWILDEMKETDFEIALNTPNLLTDNAEEDIIRYIVAKIFINLGDNIWESKKLDSHKALREAMMNKSKKDQKDEIKGPSKQLNYSLLKTAFLAEVDELFKDQLHSDTRRTLVSDIHYAIALMEFNSTRVVTEENLVKLIEELRPDMEFNANAKTKGLMVKTDFELGLKPHYLLEDDYAYCEQFSKLPTGFYKISIKTDGDGHAISFIKEENGNGYIIDPNNARLRFDNPEEAEELLMTLLSGYPEPQSTELENPYHKLTISKIEKMSAE